MKSPVKERFWSKVRKTKTCWLWVACKIRGYGCFELSARKAVLAHRYAYETLIGPIPAGLQLDHLCRNKACVNPAHLEPVTAGENMKRAAAVRTGCKHGHKYTMENTYWYQNHRACKTCRNERRRVWRKAHRV